MTLHRRRWIQGACAAATLGWPLIVRHPRAADVPRFALGVASGAPRPDGMVLWTRLMGDDLDVPVDVEWEVAHDEAFTRLAARGRASAEGAWAHSVHVEVRGLEPGRWYWYRFRALGARSDAGRTRTAPAPDADATLAVSLASCQRFDHGHYAAWRDAVADAPDVVAFVGDYIYEYPMNPLRARRHEGGAVRTLAQYRARYAQYKRDPLLQAAHAAAPWVVVWDDHEVHNDYAGPAPADAPDLAQRRADAYQAYWEHLPLPLSARPNGPSMRLAARLDWGRTARLHLLDTRQFRAVQACPVPWRHGGRVIAASDCAELRDPTRSLLGPAQEQWLAEGWDLQRRWNLVVQSTLMARCAWSDPARDARVWTDGWDGYPAARARLLGEVQARRVPGVVVLGGDVHAHYVADLKADFDDPRAPVVASEFCGTSIASHGTRRSEAERALAFNPHLHFGRGDRRGCVRLALDSRTLHADLRAVDDPDDPASASTSLARFVVDAQRPGPQRA